MATTSAWPTIRFLLAVGIGLVLYHGYVVSRAKPVISEVCVGTTYFDFDEDVRVTEPLCYSDAPVIHEETRDMGVVVTHDGQVAIHALGPELISVQILESPPLDADCRGLDVLECQEAVWEASGQDRPTVSATPGGSP